MYSNDVVLKNKERYAEKFRISEETLNKAIENALNRLRKSLDRFYDELPATMSGYNDNHYEGWSSNRYFGIKEVTWTSCLYTGMCWLAYMYTKEDAFLKTAENHIKLYVETAEKRIKLHNHDTGFKFTSSCVAAYRITGNEEAKRAALMAAEILYEHYCPVNKFILRLNTPAQVTNPKEYRTLVDSMMNIPLFFWAYEETGDKKFYDAAVGHYNTTAKYLIREDGSSYHHYQFDVETKKPVRGLTYQGFSDESCWARGHSWLLYGFPVAYKYTEDKNILDIHKAVSYYYMDNLPENYIPYWDFAFTDGSLEPRDSSPSAISACGLLEMCKYLPDSSEEKKYYTNAAHRMVNALIDLCENDREDEDGLILHYVGSKPHSGEVDTISTVSDYFYFEALVRLKNPDLKMFW